MTRGVPMLDPKRDLAGATPEKLARAFLYNPLRPRPRSQARCRQRGRGAGGCARPSGRRYAASGQACLTPGCCVPSTGRRATRRYWGRCSSAVSIPANAPSSGRTYTDRDKDPGGRLQHRAAPASPDRRRHAPEPAGAGSFGDLPPDRAFDRPLGTSDARLGVQMDTVGARRLNRSSPSCLNRPAQQTDFFHGLLGLRLRHRFFRLGQR